MSRLCSFSLLLFAGSVSAFAAADTSLLSLLPSNTQTIAYMDVATSRSTPFGKFMLAQMSSSDKSFEQMVEQTGFDPRRDLDAFLVATGVPAAGTRGQFLVLARGIFDQTAITAHATAKGMTPETVGGTNVLLATGKDQTALAFPETGVAAFGDRASVEQVLGNRSNPATLSANLQTQIATASSDNDAWFASTRPANTFMHTMPQLDSQLGDSKQRSQVMQAVLQSSGGIRFGDNIQVSFNAVTRSDKDAVSLSDLIRFVSSAIQMQRSNDPRAALLAPAMDTMALRADGRQVSTSLVIPEADLEKLVASQPRPNRAR